MPKFRYAKPAPIKWYGYFPAAILRRKYSGGFTFYCRYGTVRPLWVQPDAAKNIYKFSSQTGKILKVSCYRNYCIDFNQILHNDRDHQVAVVGGPNRRPTNPSWRTAAILKKTVTGKSPYLCNRLTDFDEIWYSDAYWPLTADKPLKFRIFENPKWRRPPFWKITKIAISLQRFDRSLRNLVCWCKMGLLTAVAVKKIRISQIQDGGRPLF